MTLIDNIFNKYLSDIENGIAIECGAVDGIFQSHTYKLYMTRQWLTYNFEANLLTYNELIYNRQTDINLNLALSNKIEEVEFYIPKGPKRGFKSSVGSVDEEFILAKKQEFVTQKVNTITFDEFVSKYDVEKIDLMILDVEGHELEVLERFKFTKVKPLYLLVESAHIDNDKLNDVLLDMYVEDKDIDVSWENRFFILKD